jgi:indolepyruvate decarboxylase
MARCLEVCGNPVILLDAAVERFALTGPILELAEKFGIPVAHLVSAKGVVSERHPQSIGIYTGAGSADTVRERVEGSDCLICVGTRLTDAATGLFSHRLNAAVRIDIEPYSVTIDGEALNAVHGSALLYGVLDRSNPGGRIGRGSPVGIESVPSQKKDGPCIRDSAPLTQAAFWRSLQQYLQPDDVIITDTGTSLFSSIRLNLPDRATFIAQPTWASLGYALPATVGTCLAAPGRRQIAFLGDGALQMTVQELSTLFRYDLKPIIFLLNNDGYTIERLIYGPESFYNDIHPWQYGLLPKVFDGHNRSMVHHVVSTGELERALDVANTVAKLHLIEVVLPRLDAAESLVRFARRAAEFVFPQLRSRNAGFSAMGDFQVR